MAKRTRRYTAPMFAALLTGLLAAASEGQTFEGYKLVWSNDSMKEGAGASAWPTGDLNGNGKADLIQPWSNAGTLGLIVYEWADDQAGYQKIFGSRNMGQGVGAMAWLIGDINGDGKDEIVQPWNNATSLGLITYEWKDGGVSFLCGSPNMGEGSGASKWMLADLNGDGKEQLIQPWANSLSLGLLVYGWNDTVGCLTKVFGSSNMGQGSGALDWLTGDVNGDGKDEIVQLWNNATSLGLIIYEWKDAGVSFLCGRPNMGEGAGAIAWMLADANGDGKDDLIQAWNNVGSLALIVYGWDEQLGCLTKIFGSSNMGEGSGAMAWLTGDVDGDGKHEIIQPWSNLGSLGMIVYGWGANGYAKIWGNSDVAAKTANKAIVAADTTGNKKTDITLVNGQIKTTPKACKPIIGPICKDYCWCDELGLYVLAPQ